MMSDMLLNLENVSKSYNKRAGKKAKMIQAANGVNFSLAKGKITALVGESGSGKSTLAKMIIGAEKPDGGSITFQGEKVEKLGRRGLRDYHRDVQMIFQDPYSAVNPLNTIMYAVSRPLINYGHVPARDVEQRVHEIMTTVHLSPPENFVDKLPYELSGGQLQRVVIARAIATNPKLLIADEPVSMLDVSIRAEILQLIDDLRNQFGIACLYITHDLVSTKTLADDIVVLYHGTIVEKGSTIEILRNPIHPYTKLLIASIPNPRHKRAIALESDFNVYDNEPWSVALRSNSRLTRVGPEHEVVDFSPSGNAQNGPRPLPPDTNQGLGEGPTA